MTLALIAGRGLLPGAVAAAQSQPPLVCALDGTDLLELDADIRFRLETLGSLLGNLKNRGVTTVCLCGAIDRPVIDPTAIDAATLPLLPLMSRALQGGDDAALRVVMEIFEAQGFAIRAAHELAPDLVAPVAVLSAARPDPGMEADAARGASVLAALAPLDVGQACVVGAGQVWGIETTGGTDHMLRTLPEGAAKARAVLVKAPKEGQDLRADMPTIGPDTVDALALAGLAGLVIRAGQTLLLDPVETRRRADAENIVLWGRAP